MITSLEQLAPEHLNAVLGSDEKLYLANLVKGLAPKSIVVEVGSWMMGSACIFADANPNVDIHCFDPFCDTILEGFPDHMLAQIDQLCGGVRSIEACQQLIGSRPNIHLHPGLSPQSCVDWNTPIDFYFEDGDHSDPVLANNLNFWLPKIKVGGYFAIHDYGDYLNLFYEFDSTQHQTNDVGFHVHRLLVSGNWALVAQPEITVILKKIK